VEFELKELQDVIGRELSREAFLSLPGGFCGIAPGAVRLLARVGCAEESCEAAGGTDALLQIRNRTGAHEWGSLEPLIRPVNGDAPREEPAPLGIAILTHAPCIFLRRWLSGARGFELLEDLLRFDGLDRKALLLEPDRFPPEHLDLIAAMVLARCQARLAALEAAALSDRAHAGLLVSCGVGLASGRVLMGGAYWFGPRPPGAPAEWLGVGDDPSRYRIESKDGQWRLLEDGDLEIVPARDHRARIRGLLEHLDRFDRFDPAGDDRTRGTATAAGLKISLRVRAQGAPVQTVMRLLGAGFLELRQMIWFSTAELTACKVGRARELLRGFEAEIDRLDAFGLERVEAAISAEVPPPAP